MDIVCITNRKLCKGEFLSRIEDIAKAKPSAIVLREKDMEPKQYGLLASKVLDIGAKYSVPVSLHYFYEEALQLECDAIHLPLWRFDEIALMRDRFVKVGASCHSLDDANKAMAYGCDYIFAGHIFNTDCKKGLPGRGLEFLADICSKVDVPVYAIGGIGPDNVGLAMEQGASGVCVMSGLMTCDNVQSYMDKLRGSVEM